MKPGRASMMAPARPLGAGAAIRHVMTITRIAMFSEGQHLVLAYTLLFVLFAAALGLVGVFDSAILGPLLVPALPLTALAMFYWDRFVIHAVKQNSPAVAGLVPGQHAAVQLAFVMAWLLALAPSIWLAAGFAQGPLIVLIFANYLTAAGLMRAGYTAGKVIYALLLLFAARLHEMDTVAVYLLQGQVVLALAAATAVFTWFGLRLAVPKGGERHWRILPAQANPVRLGDMSGSWMARLFFGKRHWLYGLKLDYDLRHGARPDYLLLHALGPNNHRFDVIVPLAVMASIVAGLWVAQGMQRGVADSGVAFLIGMVVIPLITAQFYALRRVVISARGTVAEQGLVRLAPRIARAQHMGRELARQVLANSLREWGAVAATMLVLVFLAGARLEVALVPSSIMVCTLCASGWALRDYSAGDTGFSMNAALQCVLVAAACVALLLAITRPLLWCALAVLMVASAGWIIRQRWRRMVAAPPPFPAGRISG